MIGAYLAIAFLYWVFDTTDNVDLLDALLWPISLWKRIKEKLSDKE